MTQLAILWLLLTGLVGVSVQQCTTENFEAIATGTIEAATYDTQNISVTRIHYNCLSPSPTAATDATYTSMSVSIQYTSTDDPDQLRGVRYNVQCEDDQWSVLSNTSVSVVFNRSTRVDCISCLDQTVNIDHCTCKFISS